jgi:hypothetical protein
VLVKGGADIFTAPKGSSHGAAISISSSYPPAISKPLRDALIKAVHETNGTILPTFLYLSGFFFFFFLFSFYLRFLPFSFFPSIWGIFSFGI